MPDLPPRVPLVLFPDVGVLHASITEVHHRRSGRHPRGAPFASEIARLNDVRHLDTDLMTDF